MPLSPPKPREHLHSRNITCEGFRRADGLWDIEAHMKDTKTYPIPSHDRVEIKAGEALHDMWIRVAVDSDYVIREAEVAMDATPFHFCPGIAPSFDGLVGLSLGRGFRRNLRERFAGTHGCTHIVELMATVATVAYQLMAPLRANAEGKQAIKPAHIDGCHALASSGPVVKWLHPEWYTGKE